MSTPLPQGPLPDTSTGTPGVPPLPEGGGGIDLASLLGGITGGSSSGQDYQSQVAAQQRNLTNAQAQMASDFSQINDLSNTITAATQQAGTDEGAIAAQQAKGLLQAQEAARSVAASYGGNPDDVSFIMNKLGQEWEQAEADKNNALDQVTKKQSVSFLDDPLTWFMNKMTVNTDINEFNDKEQKANSLYDQLEKINTLNTTTAQSMKAIAQTQTAATVAATTDEAAQKTAIAAAQAKLQGITYNVKGIQDLTAMSQQQVDNSVKAAQTAIAAGHLAVAQQQVKIMSDEYEQRAALYQQEVKDKQQADATDQYVADTVNAGRAAAGFPPLPGPKIFAMWKMNDPTIKDFFTAGSSTQALGKTILAPTAGGAARILADSRSPLGKTNPAVAPITNLLQESYNSIIQTAKTNPNLNIKDRNSLELAVSGQVAGVVQQMASNIKPGDNANIFQAPPLTALATDPNVKNNPLYVKVLAPQVKAGMAETDPTKIISLTVDAIQNNQISLQDAASGIASLFSSAAAMNTSTKDYMRFGIAPQATYVTPIDMTGVFGGTTHVDMTNKAQVTTALTKFLANQARLQAIQSGAGE